MHRTLVNIQDFSLKIFTFKNKHDTNKYIGIPYIPTQYVNVWPLFTLNLGDDIDLLCVIKLEKNSVNTPEYREYIEKLWIYREVVLKNETKN